MSNVYGIFKYKEDKEGYRKDPRLIELYTKEDFANKRLKLWAEEIRRGEWRGTDMVAYHPADAIHGSWIRIARYDSAGNYIGKETLVVLRRELHFMEPTLDDSLTWRRCPFDAFSLA